MRSPANARRLLDSMERLEAGRGVTHDLIETDSARMTRSSRSSSGSSRPPHEGDRTSRFGTNAGERQWSHAPYADTRVMRTAAVTLAGMLCLASLSGCRLLGLGQADPAADLLVKAPVPPGASRVADLPGKAFDQPAMEPACRPIDVRTAFWTSDLGGPDVVDYVRSHQGLDLQVSGSGTVTDHGTTRSWSVVLNPVAEASGGQETPAQVPMVVYQVAPLGSGTGIRIDAEVVPSGSSCVHN